MFDFIVFSQFQNKILENTTFDLKWLKGILKELYLLIVTILFIKNSYLYLPQYKAQNIIFSYLIKTNYCMFFY